jgi:L-arabinose isomerase
MWIGGLNALRKPFLHLHTQFNLDLPWSEIDMDFMNLNQAAHGDREAGFIHTRLRLNRKVVVGHWSDAEVQNRIGAWMRVARAWNDWQGAELTRFADNMRYVAVTEGDKVTPGTFRLLRQSLCRRRSSSTSTPPVMPQSRTLR